MSLRPDQTPGASTASMCRMCFSTVDELVTERNAITGAYGSWCADMAACRARLARRTGKAPDVRRREGGDKRPLLLGEHNPYSTDPRAALFPRPRRSAGGRLCLMILGMRPTAYLAAFRREDLIQSPERKINWSRPVAMAAADALLGPSLEHVAAPIVALGEKVAHALRLDYEPFKVRHRAGQPPILVLPHPSWRSRAWNDPAAIRRARQLVAHLIPTVAPLLGAQEEETAHVE